MMTIYPYYVPPVVYWSNQRGLGSDAVLAWGDAVFDDRAKIPSRRRPQSGSTSLSSPPARPAGTAHNSRLPPIAGPGRDYTGAGYGTNVCSESNAVVSELSVGPTVSRASSDSSGAG